MPGGGIYEGLDGELFWGDGLSMEDSDILQTKSAWRTGRKVPQNLYKGDVLAGQCQTLEYAAEIVQACNNHTALVEACHAICMVMTHEPTESLKEALLVVYNKARAALAAVEERT